MGLQSLVKRIVPTAIGFATGGPIGAVTSAISADQGARAEKKARIQNEIATNEFYKSIGSNNMSLPGISRNIGLEGATRNAGFGSGFGNFLTEASTNILGPIGTFAQGIKGLFGGGSPDGGTHGTKHKIQELGYVTYSRNGLEKPTPLPGTIVSMDV